MNIPAVWYFANIIGVERFSQHIEDMTEDVISYRNRNTPSCVSNGCPAGEAIRRLHTDNTDLAFTNLLGYLSTDGYFLAF